MASISIDHADAWPKELAKLGLKSEPGTGNEDRKVSSLDLKALFEGRKINFLSWSEMIAPISEAIIRDQKLTITNSLSLKLKLAAVVRRLLHSKQREDNGGKDLEEKTPL
jgi:hypothetical protein